MKSIETIDQLREYFIRELDKDSDNAYKYAEDLYTLDLTVYSACNSFNSLLYNSFAKSYIDNKISLHPEQLRILGTIKNNSASIISAPTSFGKTFCIFEYIAREKPKNVVLVVPTLALIDEYTKKIIKKYKNTFDLYNIHTNIDENKTYNFDDYNIFILTHDRIVQQIQYDKLEKIDFLVIDEVYKLQIDESDDRVIVLNMAYYILAEKAIKYVLLAPFIKEIIDRNKLNKSPELYNTNYSPVVNDVKIIKVENENDRYNICMNTLNKIKDSQSKILIYFPTVDGLYDFIDKKIELLPIRTDLPQKIIDFLDWAKNEIHEDWSVVKAIERGFLVHNGQIPLGTRMFQLDCFEEYDKQQYLLCTSTLLEGVNTRADSIIITKPSRYTTKKSDFTAFDFYNLVGRTGRLCEHLIGTAYYLKSDNDIDYKKVDALKDIQFEITTNSRDIKIQKNQIANDEAIKSFFNKLDIDTKTYKENIGVKLRFENVVKLYENYVKYKEDLIDYLKILVSNPRRGRYYLILILYKIIEGKEGKLDSILINSLLDKRRWPLKKIINDTRSKSNILTINQIISKIIKLKYSYIEHRFFICVSIICFFIKNENLYSQYIDKINEKILHPIEYIYFNDKQYKKMLLNLGIYERDIDKIISVIGTNFYDIHELQNILKEHKNELPNDISYVSKYVINSL